MGQENSPTFAQPPLLLGTEAHADDQQREGEDKAEEKDVPGAVGGSSNLPGRESGGWGRGGGRHVRPCAVRKAKRVWDLTAPFSPANLPSRAVDR